MKNIFKIHFTTYIFYFLLILSGYLNYLIIYLIIIASHELGHIIMIKIFNLSIESITIYPFGGVIKTNIKYNLNSNKLFLISISGIVFQIFLFLIIKDTNTYTYNIFKTLNLSLILFNLLPIIPSDGSKIIVSTLERIISYKNTLLVSNILSIICLVILFIVSKNIFIFVILYYLNINYFYNLKYIFNKFILERYLYKLKYKRNKYIKDVKYAHKCRNNHILCDNIYIEESLYYQQKFERFY